MAKTSGKSSDAANAEIRGQYSFGGIALTSIFTPGFALSNFAMVAFSISS